MANTTKAATRSRPVPAKKPSTVTAPRKSRAAGVKAVQEITQEARREMIALAAFLRAEQRGFVQGDPVEDWLAAEREVDSLLNKQATHVTQ